MQQVETACFIYMVWKVYSTAFILEAFAGTAVVRLNFVAIAWPCL